MKCLTSERRMILGNQPPFVTSWEPLFQWRQGFNLGRYWPQKFERFHERIESRKRYGAGPRPWRPGRYQTSRWQPYTGHGRFSGLADRMQGSYYAERYTGKRYRPEDYLREHGSVAEYERFIATRIARESWRMAA